MSQDRRVIVLRGIPGSGKSTMADWLASTYLAAKCPAFGSSWMEECVKYYGKNKAEPVVAIHSTDQYFMDENGNYNWTQSKVVTNHSKNYEAFRNSIDAGIPLVMVDNTNTTAKEFTKYQNYAEKNGYWVSFMVMPHPPIDDAVQRNQHNVPGDVIRKMRDRFE